MLTIKHVETTSTRVETVALRPLEYGDRAPLLEIFSGLSARSRRQRFLTPKTRLTEADLRQLTAVDDHDHVAVLAVTTTDDRPVGIARFIRDPRHPDSADVAVAVVDAWQSRGIGTLLTNALARRAVEVGVRRFTLTMACDNRAAHRLAHHGTHVTRLDLYSGTAELALLLPAG
jgi:RimJ/RimL family protein N-acetyltransferase